MDTLTFCSRIIGDNPSSVIIGSFVRFARARAFQILHSGVTRGQLVIIDAQGKHVFGKANDGETPVELRVMNEIMWGELFLSHDVGLGEAWIQGHFEVSDLKGLLNFCLDNRDGLSRLATSINSLLSYYSAWAISSVFRQNLKMAKSTVQFSYDVSNLFIQSFLGEGMQYSAAMWSEAEGGVYGDIATGSKEGDLDAAQSRKVQFYLQQARLRPGQRLLEIGSGWGGLAIAAGRLGCVVDSITLSVEQKQLADERIAEAGLSDTVHVHVCDYRQMPPSFEHAFDACISCEMLEAVGPSNYVAYFAAVDWALKRDKGTMIVSTSTQPEHRYSKYQSEDFARRHHWPNHFLPSATSLITAIQSATHGRLVLNCVGDYGIHYARTLREWSRGFQKNFHGPLVEHMQEQYPALKDPKNLEVFKRKWLYIFLYAEVGYVRAYTSLHYFTYTRPENVSEICG
ncbi:cyclopropane-fatty-acyl-phospholipid synthase [Phlebopus sp. FC_14]|nr:cyclopropane-fatty-acyl-phospholipid synthase [Phlebopus sp. FC_14]